MHVEHRDKKYRITFLNDSNNRRYQPKLSRYTTNQQTLFRHPHRTAESLFDTESSIAHGATAHSHTSSIHRESQCEKNVIDIRIVVLIFSLSSAFIICLTRISANIDATIAICINGT